MQGSFRFHSLRCSEILVSPSIYTKIRTWRFHRTEEVSNNFSVSWHITHILISRPTTILRSWVAPIPSLHPQPKFWVFGLLGPFLRSDTDTDFPRPVRSAKRLRFAATVFVRSKPVNWVRILAQMFVFLTDTKTDFLHILVRTHLLVLRCQHWCILLVIIDQICRKRSRSILIMV